MHKVKPEHHPVVFERTVFPFATSRTHSPVPSRLSTPRSARAASTAADSLATTSARRPPAPRLRITPHGVEIDAPPKLPQSSRRSVPPPARWAPEAAGGDAASATTPRTGALSSRSARDVDGGDAAARRRERKEAKDLTVRRHVYHSGHSFGLHSVENDVNPFLAHYAMPNWATTSESYGVHHRHPQQAYAFPHRNRMQTFQIHL
eukprot:TRINITY_DN4358_c0_g3_i2.p1 TRINITY_DN4358_c0_g3~~TRINITY_DN4358_c0_g3_i2.p1  ORF type:complete len:205 (+),score=32.27 TRINITY_DN4358_c0_g3_i2:230-844(+)